MEEMMNQPLSRYLEEFKSYKALGLHLDLTRGKPCKEQLDLAMKMLDVPSSLDSFYSEEGLDCRNYGGLGGIQECRRLFQNLIDVPAENILIYGNSSLQAMHQCVSNGFLYGILGEAPWKKGEVAWLCPAPGYDRHFAMLEALGVKMINTPLNEDGPDMDLIEKYVQDPSVKGVWCVPAYSNPTGITYSDEVVRRFARLKPAAKDFRIYWDEAYAVHNLYEDKPLHLLNILKACEEEGNPDLVYVFASTSKISFAGSGVAALGASKANIAYLKAKMSLTTIGADKINQLRHVRFFPDREAFEAHMKAQANILRPKFELVERILEEELSGIASWTKPLGGYFITLKVPSLASQVIARCKEAGVALTEAGAAFPYHKDPENAYIRIAPTYPSLEELSLAVKVLCLSVKIETEIAKTTTVC